MTILCLKLQSGEELIADVETTDANSIVARDVLQLIAVPDEATGQVKMAIMPFMPHTKGEFIIPAEFAIVAFPTDELENMYKQRFGKIITPPKDIKLVLP